MFKIRETPREKNRNAQLVIFAREYVVDLNAARASLAAGLARDEEHAKTYGSWLLDQPRVKPLVRYLQQNRAQRLDIKADRVVEELQRIAFSNMMDYMEIDAEGQPVGLDLRKLTRDQAAAIQEISEDATGGSGDGERRLIIRRRFKLSDKLRAMELLGKYLGMYQERVRVDHVISIAESVKQGRERLQLVRPTKCLPDKIA